MTTSYTLTIIPPQGQQFHLPVSSGPFGSYNNGDFFFYQGAWLQISHVSHIVAVDPEQRIQVRTAVKLDVPQQEIANQ